MTRQTDLQKEVRETARRDLLVKLLEFRLVGALESQGITMLGFSIRYEDFDCLMTIRAEINGERVVAFVGSDTIMNCVLKAGSEANRTALKWRADKYHKE